MLTPPRPTPKMVNDVKSILDNNIESSKIKFNGKKYTISIQDGKCVSLTRDDKKWYKSVCDFFNRGFTSGQNAFIPRSHQLKVAVNDYLSSNKKEPIYASLEEVKNVNLDKCKKDTDDDAKKLWKSLIEFNKINNYKTTSGNANRYRDISSRESTQLNEKINANKISITDCHIANAGQYPKDEQIEDHLKILADNKTSCLVVLASNEDIKKVGYTDYFTTNNTYATSTLVEKNHKLGSKVLANIYVLATKNSKGICVEIPVVHVTNWPDKKPIPRLALREMVKVVTDFNKIFQDKNKHLLNNLDEGKPFVHCKAGVGRTGTFIAEYYMSNHSDKNISLERVIEDMRTSRNEKMVQTQEQLNTLVAICKDQNRPIFKSDEKPNPAINEPIYANVARA
ncbi:protein-tyrosine phosphatase family protein [Yersinia hibernica]|uniref:protein-tyrosine-phosphatase n=1 Tax=Yersinia hibernica TaxID=2339259 RepID=A0ABX5R630_9GAMM|nr:protein-tyrosine phosphatase family protein [Yersinia hibernica]QAX80993.1 hypothetical protein D5F51_22190 [Yersinia hibernica]